MEVTRRAPGKDLAPFARSLWVARGAPLHREERLPPQPIVRLVVTLGEHDRLIGVGGEVAADAVLIGLQRQELIVAHPAEVWQCGADLTPAGVAAFTSTPLSAVNERVQDADPVIRWSGTWRERLRATTATDDTLEVLQQLLRSVRRPEFEIDGRLARAVSRLERDPDIPIGTLASEAGLSVGWFARRFRRDVGLTARRYAEVVRSARAAASGA